MRYYLCKKGSMWRDNAIVLLDEEDECIVSVVLKNASLEHQKVVEEDCNSEDICPWEKELEVVKV